MAVNLDLPTTGGDSGHWGDKLNAALSDLQDAYNALPDPSTLLTPAAADAKIAAQAATDASTYVPQLQTVGSFTYNTDGTVASDPDGNAYTYNTDGTVHTVTKGGVTRTFSYNADGTIASVA